MYTVVDYNISFISNPSKHANPNFKTLNLKKWLQKFEIWILFSALENHDNYYAHYSKHDLRARIKSYAKGWITKHNTRVSSFPKQTRAFLLLPLIIITTANPLPHPSAFYIIFSLLTQLLLFSSLNPLFCYFYSSSSPPIPAPSLETTDVNLAVVSPLFTSMICEVQLMLDSKLLLCFFFDIFFLSWLFVLIPII